MTVDQVASSLGIMRTGNKLSRCPACGADKANRPPGDAPSVTVSKGSRLWRHWSCGAGGDAISLVAFSLTGAALKGNPRAAEVRSWFADRGLCTAAGAATDRARTRWRRPVTWTREPPQAAAPKAQALARIDEFWRTCRPVLDDDGAAAYLRDRGVPPDLVELFDLARVLPDRGKLPVWARCGRRDWRARGNRLVLPMTASTGKLATVQAVNPADGSKLFPVGRGAAGAVFADPLARLWLRAADTAAGAPAADEVRRVGLVVAEGAPDFLTWATEYSDADEDAPAVTGIASGSWTGDVAARVPAGCVVTIATHNDTAGDRYARKVRDSLHGRCDVRRFRYEVQP